MAPSPRSHLTLRLFCLVCLISFGTWFPMGYSITAMNGPQNIIVKWIRSIECERLSYNSSLWCDEVSEETMLTSNLELNTIWALSTSIVNLGGMLSILITNFLIDKLGLKRVFYFYGVVLAIGTVIFHLASVTSVYELLIVGRFVIGFALGIICVITPIYVSELTPPDSRGGIGTLPIVLYVLGLITAMSLSLPSVLGNDSGWSDLVLLTVIPAIVMCVLLPICPETPRRLFIKEQNRQASQKVLVWLRGTVNVADEMAKMEDEIKENESRLVQVTIWGLLRDKFLRSTLVICAVPMLTNQLSGYSCVSFYSTSIFSSVGLSKVNSIYASIGAWLTYFVGSLTCMFIVDRAGRRTLLLISHSVIIFALSLFVIFMVMTEQSFTWAKYGSAACIFIFMGGYAIALASVPWILPADMFAQEARGSALTLISLLQWLSAQVVTLLFPIIVARLEEYTFLLFISFVIFSTVYIALRLPETKGKDIGEVQRILREKFK